MRVLIVDADPAFSKAARAALHSDALTVEVERDAALAIGRATATPYAAIVLDLDGAGELLTRLRRERIDAPILALTSAPQPAVRIDALQRGADDCLVRPVLMAEFAARVHALLRRAGRKSGDCLEIEDLVLHCDRRRAFRAGQALPLTAREFAALECLVRAHGEPVSSATLLAMVWRGMRPPRENFIAVLMMRLRKKVDAGHPIPLLHTRRGAGYVAGVPGR